MGISDWSYFAVFDGHCGSGVSTHSSQNLLSTIMKTDEFQKMPPQTSVQTDSDDVISIIQRAIHTGFLQYVYLHVNLVLSTQVD